VRSRARSDLLERYNPELLVRLEQSMDGSAGSDRLK
jgi:hypothetical protein